MLLEWLGELVFATFKGLNLDLESKRRCKVDTSSATFEDAIVYSLFDDYLMDECDS